MIASTGPGLMTFITVFVLAAFVGYEVVSKVPSILHTPLMSGSNAIHGIILVGTMIVLGERTALPNSRWASSPSCWPPSMSWAGSW